MKLRPIEPGDDAAVAAIIRTVMSEHGADGAGFAIHDAEVDAMYETYTRPGAAYFVVEDADGRVVGGGGFGPLVGADPSVCELRKMYFLRSTRGQGVGKQLLERCLQQARAAGYRTMYLETLTGMDAAQHLYARAGFEKLCAPMGATGHFGCDRWYARPL